MKTTSRTTPLIIALVVVLVTFACTLGEPTLQDYQEMAGNEPTRNALTVQPTEDPGYQYGTVVGTMSTIWKDVWVDNVAFNPVCTDDQAEYHLLIAPVNIAPANSPSTDSVPSGKYYFRLDVMAARYLPDDKTGKCNISAGRSDAVTHFIFAGSYDPANLTFNVFTCGNSGDVGEGSEIQSTIYRASGNLVCRSSDQMKMVFTFSDMQMLQGTGTPPLP
jgi:hypothetical protein